jgi:hypothetical protein
MKKKLMLIMAFGILSANAMGANLWLKGGIVEGAGSDSIEDPGYTVGLEFSQGVLGFIDLGAGMAYNGNLKFDDGGAGITGNDINYDMMPIYGFAKFNIIPVALKPYVVARLGANIVVNDDTNYVAGASEAEGGIYGAVGIGLEFSDVLQGELLYSISEVKNNPNGEDNVDMISLTIGYNFL